MRDYFNATNAVQIYLPRELDNRLTWGVSGGRGDAAIGIGYARRVTENADVVAGVGKSNDSVVWKIGISAEF